MGKSTVFYLLSVLLGLYSAYLAAFRAYKMEYDPEKSDYVPTAERFVYPRFVYILMAALCFVPMVNSIFATAFFILSIVGRSLGDFCIKSWLFEKPEKKR